ncbi:GntR family transcriptional regulator [Bacillus sp. es.034]|jgi:GntR family transcriptional regulator, negative regulator for fad regulon and positive regulator of fabA|uniref:GntR family transcriptional regulator n=1 Tax=Bacillus sp. es.034 TaxID=1761763 RepID=UPI000BF60D61|nr:GntR family transcriptional regulator [Bacillus sp. es.034]PFG03578.1 GntR family negative regulator for fad regulon and positive regulator of fabA [Bacillus sp. es.034]
MKERSSDIIARDLTRSILGGELKIQEPLQSERDLAVHYKVGRPTIREALQKLERDGWIRSRKGMPAVVNDYWKQGNLMTIVTILQHEEEIPDEFIVYMLELRVSITPAYFRDAMEYNKLKVISLFASFEDMNDTAETYAEFDWHIQHRVAMLSPNPIYLLILNSFKDVYIRMAEKYFSDSTHRTASRDYYDTLLKWILDGDFQQAEQTVRDMMETSIRLWKQKMDGGKEG